MQRDCSECRNDCSGVIGSCNANCHEDTIKKEGQGRGEYAQAPLKSVTPRVTRQTDCASYFRAVGSDERFLYKVEVPHFTQDLMCMYRKNKLMQKLKYIDY